MLADASQLIILKRNSNKTEQITSVKKTWISFF